VGVRESQRIIGDYQLDVEDILTARKFKDVILSDLVKTIPSGRVGSIDDIADAVLFLVSERATYINGAALVVDGSKSVVI
jgi:NAD(P)-dependent dehydrogenase (short-subunit alcohol dehydrogenase family)